MMLWCIGMLLAILLPALMLIFGTLSIKRPPKKVNGIYGYRTLSSMRNEDTWKTAQAKMGELWQKYGKIALLVSAILSVVIIPLDAEVQRNIFGVIFMGDSILLFVTIGMVERHLKKLFNKDGSRREQ